MAGHDASTQGTALAEALLERFAARIARCPEPFLLGLSGLQGSGKTTLARALVRCARARGWPAERLSLDDVYRTRAERRRLAAAVHPLLITRGPPGTHDLDLLRRTLDALQQASPSHPARLPRFDKGRDTRRPPSRWPRVVEPPRLLVLEGWCVGLHPQAASQLREPANALERREDADGRWRRWVDAQLRDYLPLWRQLHALVVLQAPGWDVVRRWRDQAEQALRAQGSPHAMDARALGRFVQHYERLSRHALASLPARADLVVPLDRQRRPGPMRPGSSRRRN